MLDLSLKVYDRATKWVENNTRAAAAAHIGALKSSGFRLRDLIKSGMQQQAPGGAKWPPGHFWTRTQQLRQSMRRHARAQKSGGRTRQATKALLTGAKQPLQRLARAARYTFQSGGQPGAGAVRIGFLTAGAAQRAAYHAVEHTIPVTAKMRRMIFAAGFMIRKSSFKIPARPAVEPVYRQNRARLTGFVQQRTNAAWAGKDPKTIAPPF